MLSTTFALLHDARACADRYRHLAKALGGIEAYGRDTPITIERILQANGLDDALWALQAVPAEQKVERDKLARLMACDCAERALPLYEVRYPADTRPRQTIEVSRRFAHGQATAEELAAAWAAARDAADAARDAARDAADAAWVAADAAWVAAWVAARDAARDAADAAVKWQTERLLQYLRGEA